MGKRAGGYKKKIRDFVEEFATVETKFEETKDVKMINDSSLHMSRFTYHLGELISFQFFDDCI